MIKQLPNEIVSRVKLRTMFYTTPILVFPSNTVIAQYKTYYEQNGYVTNIFINLSLGHISNISFTPSTSKVMFGQNVDEVEGVCENEASFLSTSSRTNNFIEFSM